VALMAGRVNDGQQLAEAGFSHVACINPPGISLEEAMKPETAKAHIRKTVSGIIAK
jgi:glycerate kinase